MTDQSRLTDQSYSRHTKWVPAYHFFLTGLLFAVFIGSLVNLVSSFGDHVRLYSASLITALTFGVMTLALLARVFPLKAQDRAIRAEENLRHYVLTNHLLDARLSLKQIIALRFASDAEFPELARRAAAENMTPDAIKRSISHWRPDHDRL